MVNWLSKLLDGDPFRVFEPFEQKEGWVKFE